MVGYVPRADDEEHLQTIPYIDPALSMKENSAWQSCVGSVQQCYMDHKFVLMSLYLNCMRHSSHFAHFNPGPLMFHLRGEIPGSMELPVGPQKSLVRSVDICPAGTPDTLNLLVLLPSI